VRGKYKEKDMRMVIDSSVLDAVDYDANAQCLDVDIHGHVYRYSGVTEDDFLNLLHATSKGQFFNMAIKPKPCSRIR
jgi:hypothetical protein